MHLLYSNCVPVINYAAEVNDYKCKDMTNCNTAINDAMRKIFTFSRRESVISLRESYGYKSIYVIFSERRSRFLASQKIHSNCVPIKRLSS